VNVGVSSDQMLCDCCKSIAGRAACLDGQYVKSAAFAISAATAILDRNPVLQFLSRRSAEKSVKIPVGQERKAVLLRLILAAQHFAGCHKYSDRFPKDRPHDNRRASRLPDTMITAELPAFQIPLIHIVESDDLHLERQEDILWFNLLRNFSWHSFRPTAARYYEALWQFNVCQAQARRERDAVLAANPETQPEATMRLLFERATLCEDAPALHELPASAAPQIHVNPNDLRPGCTPQRWAGKKPKCFFAILKAFMGVMAQGQPAEPEIVFAALQGNPSYARTCGFTLPAPDGHYRQSDVPSLRKLEQFDQIMTDSELWSDAAVDQVAKNLKTGCIQAESTVIHDTTHYHAYSGMQVVELPQAVEPSENASATQPVTKEGEPNEKGKKAKKARKKSHPKTTKRCRCKDRQHCPHPWINADEGAGTVVKSTGKMYWAHKASTLCFPRQQVLLDAAAMSDAASHDSKSILPHLGRLFTRHPDLRGIIQRHQSARPSADRRRSAARRGPHHAHRHSRLPGRLSAGLPRLPTRYETLSVPRSQRRPMRAGMPGLCAA